MGNNRLSILILCPMMLLQVLYERKCSVDMYVCTRTVNFQPKSEYILIKFWAIPWTFLSESMSVFNIIYCYDRSAVKTSMSPFFQDFYLDFLIVARTKEKKQLEKTGTLMFLPRYDQKNRHVFR